jgi:hypothetical protein
VNRVQVIQMLVVLFFVISPALRWALQKLQEQARQKRALDEMERRRLEALRTGRNLSEIERIATAPPTEPTRAQRESEAALRRQAEIEEFRRRQQERARQRAQARAQPPTAQQIPPIVLIPGSTGPTVPMPAQRQQQRQAQREQRPTQRAQRQPQRPQRQAPQPAPAPSRPRSRLAADLSVQTPSDPRATQAFETPETAGEQAAAALRSAGLTPRTAEEWRRAIILNAILSPPPSLAGEQEPGMF